MDFGGQNRSDQYAVTQTLSLIHLYKLTLYGFVFRCGYQKGWYTFQLAVVGGPTVTRFYMLTRYMYAFIRIQVLFVKNSIVSLQQEIWYYQI